MQRAVFHALESTSLESTCTSPGQFMMLRKKGMSDLWEETQGGKSYTRRAESEAALSQPARICSMATTNERGPMAMRTESIF